MTRASDETSRFFLDFRVFSSIESKRFLEFVFCLQIHVDRRGFFGQM